MPKAVKVLMTQRFTDAQVDRVRAISPHIVVIQKSVQNDWDSSDIKASFDGDEEILYCFMPPSDLSVAPRLKWVQLHSAGINQLTNHPILKSNIRITTSSGIHAVPIGEFAIAMMLALGRKVPLMVHNQSHAEWPHDKWHLFLGTELPARS
jgi:phosphoglycerate dehydrogenase-like enzyme